MSNQEHSGKPNKDPQPFLDLNNQESSLSENHGQAVSQSENIDQVHSLKSTKRRTKQNDDGQGSSQNASKSVCSDSDFSDDENNRSLKSDSEPGMPVQAFTPNQGEFMPYGRQIQRKVVEVSPQPNLPSARKKPFPSFDRKRSVQFNQDDESHLQKQEVELATITQHTQDEHTNEDGSVKIPSHYKVRRSSAIDREIINREFLVKQENNNLMLQKIINPIWAKSINQILDTREGTNESYFAQLWAQLFFVIQSYNFFTAFFFVGIEGSPTGIWYLLEVISEILMIFDFIARWLIRVHFSQAWSQMFLLHDRGGTQAYQFYIRLIASVPYQIITSVAASKNPIVRQNIWIAYLRLLKLLKFSQVVDYFNAIEFQKRQIKNYSINKTLFVTYYGCCFMHFSFCFIAWCARVDPEASSINKKGWFFWIGFNDFEHSLYDIYREAFATSTMAMMGLANGAVWATTNIEYFGLIVQFVTGASLLIGYFAWIVSEFALRNIQMYENSERYELAKQFCDMRNLPYDIRLKIQYFYHNMRINFEQYNEKTQILQNLPQILQTQIAPLFNSQVLKNIKFLQMARPEFVSKIACKLSPEVSLNGDLIVKRGEIAHKMYFVQDGSLEVLATDHHTTIAFMGSGAYFGEIGVLITGKRSLSIKALSNCLCYSVNAKDFLEILNEYPEQTQFLRAVGYQRLQTTEPPEVKNPRGAQNVYDKQKKTEKWVPKEQDSSFDEPAERNYDNDISFLRLNSRVDQKIHQNDQIKTKPWLTKQYNNLDYFIIMPFSPFFYAHNVIMLLAFTYVVFMVCYGIGFQEDHGFDPLLILCQFVFAIDIFLRMRTGITHPSHISTNLQDIFTYYINSWLFYDMLASIPIEYVLQIYYPVISRWVMVLKFFKIFRLYESLQIYLKHTRMGLFHQMLFVYFYLVLIFSHICACYACYVCEWYPKYPDFKGRFDGYSLITFYNTFKFSDGHPYQFDQLKKYMFYLYFGTASVCQQNYADLRPYTDPEEYGAVTFAVIGRIILAFTCSECAQYLGEIYKGQSRKLMSTYYLDQWMRKIKLPKLLIERIKIFNQMQFRFSHQIDESEILEGLPPTLKSEVKAHLFAPLIRTWEAISKENIGECMSIVNELQLVTFPENEYVVKIGEIGNEMYFIVDGLCQVLTSDGNQLAVLKQGQNFGEMALLDPELPMRMASVKTLTNVNLAVMTREKFVEMSELYPQFKENIEKMVKIRLHQFLKQKKKDSSDLNQQMIRRLQQSESLSGTESSLTDSLTDSDFSEEERKASALNMIINVDDQGSSLRIKKNKVAPLNNNGIEGKGPQSISTPTRSPLIRFQNQGVKDDDDDDKIENVTTERGLITKQDQKQRRGPQIKRSDRNIGINKDIQQEIKSERTSKKLSGSESQHRPGSDSQRKHKPAESDQNSELKNSKSQSLRRTNTEKLVQNLQDVTQKEQNEKKMWPQRQFYINAFKWIVQAVVHYNLWFIPIHAAYKFPIQGIWFVLEVITIVVYFFELIHRFVQLRHFNRVLTEEESMLSIRDRKLKQDYEKLQQKILVQKQEFVLTLIVIVPLNLIFDRIGWTQNVATDTLIMFLRIVKIRPIGKIFKQLHKINLALFRVLEIIYYNYLFCNIYSCILIDMAIWQPDARKNWLRRLPINPNTQMWVRPDADWKTDLTPLSVYINAQYYVQGTFSHVANGDIVMTNAMEWLYNSCLMVTSTFIYFYLFANIASIVSNLTSETHVAFLKRRNLILSQVKKNNVSSNVVDEVNQYFDYQFQKYNGLTEKQMLEKLPERIKLDIKLSQYNQILRQSLIFRKSSGEFDSQLANTFFSTLKTQIYLNENYITKIGQIFDNSFLILEGIVNVVGFDNNDLLGSLKPGDFFGTDIAVKTNYERNKNFFQYTQGEGPPRVLIKQKDSFEGRSMVHLISKTFVIIGVLDKSDTKLLYKTFPQLKKVYKICNRYIFDVGRKQIEKHIWEKTLTQPTRETCLTEIKNQIAFGTPEFYENIVRTLRTSQLHHQKNFSYMIKRYYLICVDVVEQQAMYKALFAKNKQQYIIEAQKLGATWCCEDVWIEEHGRLQRAIRYVHFINLVYTSFAIPFYIGYNINIRGGVLLVEVVSSLISICIFFLNFRLPYIENGERSTNLILIAKQYLQRGMIVDFFGMLPMNIILEYLVDTMHPGRTMFVSCLIGLARCTRLCSIMQAIVIYEEIKADFKKIDFAVYVIGNGIFCFLVGHWIVCLWTFLILVVEQHDPDNWWDFTKLGADPTWSAYLHQWYAVINITTGAGVGDIVPTTDLERAFFCFMINSGDIIFALVFGLINNMVLSNRMDDDTGNFINSMVRTERCLAKFEISGIWKDRIEQFYTYQQKVTSNSQDLNYEYLEQYLPSSLVKKILYHAYSDLIRPFVQEYNSENLIKDICFYMKSQLFMPDDFVTTRGDASTYIYFVQEGKAVLVGLDNNTVIKVIGPGSYIGDRGTLTGKKRNITVIAKTFLLIKSISAEDLNSLLATYPEIEIRMREKAAAEYKEIGKVIKSTFKKELQSDIRQLIRNADQKSDLSSSDSSSIEKEQMENNRPIAKKKNTRKADDSDSDTSSAEKDDSVEGINQYLKGVANQKKAELGKNPNRGRRFTVVDNFRHTSSLVGDVYPENLSHQQTARIDGLPYQVDEISAVLIQNKGKEQTTNRSKQSTVHVKRRLSGVSVGKSLNIKQVGDNLSISVRN